MTLERMPGRTVERTWPSDPTRDSPPRHRRACGYTVHLPDPLAAVEVRLDSALAALLSEAEQALRELNSEGSALLAPLARLLLRTESIASSNVEGMHANARDLARAEAKAESGGVAGATTLEVLANIDAMVLAVETAGEGDGFTEADLLAIHRRLLERAPHRDIPGRIRITQNWIGGNDYTPCGADFVPPPADDVPSLLTDLYHAINDASHAPLIHAALVHAQFETIHPFIDGNGRTGRALVHVVLRRRGLAPHFVPPVSVMFAGARHRYIAALTAYRAPGTDGVTAWIEHFAECMRAAARLASQYVHAVRSLQEHWRHRVRTLPQVPRTDATAWAIIEMLPAHPMLSAPVASAVTGRARSRVYEAIGQLVDVGVLTPVSPGQRNRLWEANGLLDLVTQLESGQSPVADID